ncbi:MAG: hypothetical protein V7749_14330 [Cocleimonas sp.]
MTNKTKLNSLLNIAKESFRSLDYADWSTTIQDFPNSIKAAEVALNKDGKRVNDNCTNESGA